MDIKERKKYAEQWAISSSFFYDNNDYDWMCEQIKDYNTVLEIGSGAGHSTLALLEKGHKVFAVEKNEYCLHQAKELLENNGFECCTLEEMSTDCSVALISADICNDDFADKLNGIPYDVVVCWNIGTHWSKEMMLYYIDKLIAYGLTIEQIKANIESSYAEFIQWQSCKIASRINAPVHLIDRNKENISEENDEYYYLLKDQFGYRNIKYNSRSTISKSIGGRPLTDGSDVYDKPNVDIVLVSVLINV